MSASILSAPHFHNEEAAYKFVEARVAADLEALMEDDTARLQPIDAAGDDMLLQLEAGNAIGQQPAGAIGERDRPMQRRQRRRHAKNHGP